jgi:hypothetical protein
VQTPGSPTSTYDGTEKPVTHNTDPPGLFVKLTYDGDPDPPVASGSHQVEAMIEDDLYQGLAAATLVIAPRSFTTPVTGWLVTNSTSVTGADTSSPLLNSANGSGTSGASIPFFARTIPHVLTAAGDSLHLGGTVTVNTPGGTANQGLWFRFGLYDNPNAASSLTVNNWLGYTAMAQASATNSLHERIGGTSSGDFGSSIFGTASRPPDASPTYLGANSPGGIITLRADQTITRTATGVSVASRLASPGGDGAPDTVYLSSTYTDATPNNNGLSNGISQTSAINHSPRYDSVGFVLSGAYINSTNTCSVQFHDVEITYTPGTDSPPRAIARENWRFQHFGTPENAGAAADSFDADHDGETNLMEFATGQNPHAGTLAITELHISGPEYIFTYTRNKASLAEMTFLVEHSDTLEPGSWSTTDVTEISPPADENDNIQTMNVEVPNDTAKRFYRLRVVSQP